MGALSQGAFAHRPTRHVRRLCGVVASDEGATSSEGYVRLLRDVLQEIYHAKARSYQDKGSDAPAYPRVLVAYEDGRAANPEYVSRHAKTYMEKCGASDMRLHDLRHTAATILVKRMPVIYVSAFLGHNQVSTTMDIYSHVLLNERHLASDMMGGFLQSVAVCTGNWSGSERKQS